MVPGLRGGSGAAGCCRGSSPRTRCAVRWSSARAGRRWRGRTTCRWRGSGRLRASRPRRGPAAPAGGKAGGRQLYDLAGLDRCAGGVLQPEQDAVPSRARLVRFLRHPCAAAWSLMRASSRLASSGSGGSGNTPLSARRRGPVACRTGPAGTGSRRGCGGGAAAGRLGPCAAGPLEQVGDEQLVAVPVRGLRSSGSPCGPQQFGLLPAQQARSALSRSRARRPGRSRPAGGCAASRSSRGTARLRRARCPTRGSPRRSR